jgi:hypothetical protein
MKLRATLSVKSALTFVVIVAAAIATRAQGDPLPSWNDTDAKRAITSFVSRFEHGCHLRSRITFGSRADASPKESVGSLRVTITTEQGN